MHAGKFQWHNAKAARNFAVHHVKFEAARDAFDDPYALDWLDESQEYDEDRFVLIGMSEGRLIVVAYCMRGPTTRIISARLAAPSKRWKYHERDEI
jgi:uncharacterized DUF497 family protein